MRLSAFIEKIESAGWEGVHDVQHKYIEELWRQLYPHSAELEDEMNDMLLLNFGGGHTK